MLSFGFGGNTEMTGNVPGKEGVVQETNSSEDRLRRESASANEAPENEAPTKKDARPSNEGAPTSASTASEKAGRAALGNEPSKENSEGRELTSINGLALGLCLGVAFGIIFDSLAIGIGLGLALGAAFATVNSFRNVDIWASGV